AQVNKAFRELGVDMGPGDDTPFIDLYVTYLNPPTIGKNLLGEEQYRWLLKTLKPGEHAIAIMANGKYSFKGSGFVRGGIFDRIQVVQGDQTIFFHDLDYYPLTDTFLKGMPDFKEKGIFIIRDVYRFDPGSPWRLELLVRHQVGPLKSVFTTFSTTYHLPKRYVAYPITPKEENVPLWRLVWQERLLDIAILTAGLLFLTAILMFQDVLVRRRKLVIRLRTAFLVYTLVFIGWYALGQLSVVNVLTFLNALIHEFRWETFLIDPMLFILWSYVAATLLLWGRGVFCGWLCPFGALQKLVNQAARWLRVPQLNLPFAVHERLWSIKYLIFLGLFAISLESMSNAERLAEVEPFKTAINLHFDRAWPYVLYAAILIAISVFNSKFYCKYLCPLGAA
ncbi:MAG: 4Fe-4S binding protein, partial [Gammaproteobacteria bacterium]